MGLIQFPMPYIGNGAADISKQLFLFNISFDFGLTVLIYMLFKTVSKKISKKSFKKQLTNRISRAIITKQSRNAGVAQW